MLLRDAILERYHYIQTCHPEAPKLYHSFALGAPRGATFLDPSAYTLSYVVLDGHRITPNTSSGIVLAQLTLHPYLASDIIRFLYHRQSRYLTPEIFAEVRWMVPDNIMQVWGNPWQNLCVQFVFAMCRVINLPLHCVTAQSLTFGAGNSGSTWTQMIQPRLRRSSQ